MAKIILLNGSPHPQGCTATALDEMIRIFDSENIETELIHVGNKAIRGCISCGYCEKNGKCVFDDDLVNEVAPKFESADGLVVGLPTDSLSEVRCITDHRTERYYRLWTDSFTALIFQSI